MREVQKCDARGEAIPRHLGIHIVNGAAIKYLHGEGSLSKPNYLSIGFRMTSRSNHIF
jgi:hypothetical protein